MNRDEVVFFNLVRDYAEARYSYELDDRLELDANVGAYRLRFKPTGSPSHAERQVLVFQEQFDESVSSGELSEAVRRNIDEALEFRSGKRQT
jgi:hypothetical protein